VAKDKNKKKKKKKLKVSKQPVSMVLVQNQGGQEPLSAERMEAIYAAFRKRCETKSNHKYVDNGERPILLRLYLKGTKFDSTAEFLVKVGSFGILKAKDSEQEIGFEVELKSLLTPKKTHRLEVLRQQHKATLFITL